MSVLLLTMGPQLGITADLPVVGVGGAGVIRFRAIGAVGPVKWTLVDSTLPAEWDSALNPDGNAVTLTTADAETAGTFSVTVRAVDSARIPVVRSFDVRVMALPLTISGTFPDWEVDQTATGALTINGGVPPYSGLAITSGALPAGVSLSIVGNQIVPSGSPSSIGAWSATIEINDSISTPATIALSGEVTAADTSLFATILGLSPWGYYRLNETGTISTVSDSSGNGNHGTAHTSALSAVSPIVSGNTGAFGFSGGPRINLPTYTRGGDNAYTIMAFIRTTSTSIMSICSADGGVAGRAYQLRLESYTSFLSHVTISPSTVTTRGTTTLSDGNTHMVVAVYDPTLPAASGRVKLYVDGALHAVSTTAITNSASSMPFAIGSRNNADNREMFTGQMSDVAIFTRALSSAEVSAIWDARNNL